RGGYGSVKRSRPASRICRGPRKPESRAVSRLGLDRNAPTAGLDDLLHDRQPDPAALDGVARGECLEHAPDPLVVLRRDSRPVIRYRELDAAIDSGMRHGYFGIRAMSPRKLQRVAEQVHEDLLQGRPLRFHDRHLPRDMNLDAGRCRLQLNDLPNERASVDSLRWICRAARA